MRVPVVVVGYLMTVSALRFYGVDRRIINE
jgi:hypothetical protein